MTEKWSPAAISRYAAKEASANCRRSGAETTRSSDLSLIADRPTKSALKVAAGPLVTHNESLTIDPKPDFVAVSSVNCWH